MSCINNTIYLVHDMSLDFIHKIVFILLSLYLIGDTFLLFITYFEEHILKMPKRYGFSDYECKIIQEQIKRRFDYRQQFLRMKSDPCLHSKESGYVFDPAVQRYMSMKVTLYEYFVPNFKAKMFGICTIVLPMFTYGYAIWNQRCERECDIRCGKLRYRDRLFKLI